MESTECSQEPSEPLHVQFETAGKDMLENTTSSESCTEHFLKDGDALRMEPTLGDLYKEFSFMPGISHYSHPIDEEPFDLVLEKAEEELQVACQGEGATGEVSEEQDSPQRNDPPESLKEDLVKEKGVKEDLVFEEREVTTAESKLEESVSTKKEEVELENWTQVKEEIKTEEFKEEPENEEYLAEEHIDEEIIIEQPPQSTVYPVQEALSEGSVSQTEGLSGKFAVEQLQLIWEVAKKLSEARLKYNAASVCRRRTPRMVRKMAGSRWAAQCRSRARATNRGVCNIGKGDGWKDPPEWDYGQPLPEEICEEIAEVLPWKTTPGIPTISLDDDENTVASSSEYFHGASKSERSKGSSLTKSLKNNEDTCEPITISDDELPDFSSELGIVMNKACSQSYSTADSDVCSIAVEPLKAVSKLGYGRKRRLNSINTTPGGSRSLSPQLVTLTSDDSDTESELVQLPKRRNKEPDHDKANVSVWSCPICLEPKDKVSSTMSTNCGHVFCGPCLEASVKLKKQCPTCRKKLTMRQIHKLYL